MTNSPGPSAEVTQRAEESGFIVDRLSSTIDRNRYSPALLSLLNNVLVWGGSRAFHHLHGVGTNEWRIISALGNYPGSTAQELCEVLGLNKSIASRSVNLLLNRELIAQLNGPRGSRHLYLTDAGAKVHDDLLPVALERQRILHESLSDDEVDLLHDILVRMLEAGPALQSYEQEILAQPSTDS